MINGALLELCHNNSLKNSAFEESTAMCRPEKLWIKLTPKILTSSSTVKLYSVKLGKPAKGSFGARKSDLTSS